MRDILQLTKLLPIFLVSQKFLRCNPLPKKDELIEFLEFRSFCFRIKEILLLYQHFQFHRGFSQEHKIHLHIL